MYFNLKIILSIIIILFLSITPVKLSGTTIQKELLGSDTIKTTQEYKLSYKQLIVPSTLILYGTIEMLMAPNKGLLNNAVTNKVIARNPDKFEIDDVSQYVPMASVYALNLLGIKGEHNFKDRTIILGLASLIVATSVNTMKYTVREQRPDKSTYNSFPSGHTAVAFMGAEFLRQEYKNVSIWYGILGYTIATGTGALRVYNNRHWVGDVFCGAGIGILSTKLAYWLYPTVDNAIFKGKKDKRNKNNIALAPFYNGDQAGLALSMQF